MRVEVQPNGKGHYLILKDGRLLAHLASLVLDNATWDSGRMFGDWLPESREEGRNGTQCYRIAFDPVHPSGYVRVQTHVPVTSAERVYCESGGIWARMF